MLCVYFMVGEEVHSYISFFRLEGNQMSIQWNTTPQELKNIISNLTVYLAMIESDPTEQHSISVEL